MNLRNFCIWLVDIFEFEHACSFDDVMLDCGVSHMGNFTRFSPANLEQKMSAQICHVLLPDLLYIAHICNAR